MIVILLIIIACVLLFGKDKTKEGIGALIGTIICLFIIGWFVSLFG